MRAFVTGATGLLGGNLVRPLAREHVRMLGRYHSTLDESVAGGSLRPLRDPEEIDEYELPLPNSGELPPLLARR